MIDAKGRTGIIYQIGKNGIAARGADGKAFGIHPRDAQILSPAPQAARTSARVEPSELPSPGSGMPPASNLDDAQSSSSNHAGEQSRPGDPLPIQPEHLRAVRQFFQRPGGPEGQLKRLGIEQVRASPNEAPGGMVMCSDGRLKWCEEVLFTKSLWVKPELRSLVIDTLLIEEMAHRANHLVESHSSIRSGLRWKKVPGPTKELVSEAYGDTTHFSKLSAEYIRMLVQVRNGFPLSEEFFQNTSALRATLMKPQSPEVEGLVSRVTEMLLNGRDPHPKSDSASHSPYDDYYAGELRKSDADGTNNE